MADIQTQLDVASANRFISSLSKSLQALCHGCMDFDAGIEIVGYINVNIDSGSKVDYVLNEKVLKSTTNSMTFVSNSFLAKKDQPKHCTDGSCSPIPELNYPQPRSRGGHSYPGSQLYRSSGIYSPHSQVLRGSQKRAWAGVDWRTSPRKFPRGAKSQYGSYQQHSSLSESYPYSNQTSADSSHSASAQQSSYTSQQEYEGSGTSTDVSVKKEVEENTDQSSGYQNDGGETTNQNSDISDSVNIKTDPDSLVTQENSNENVPAKYETDSFLEPTKTDETSEDPSGQGENQDSGGTNYENSSFSVAPEESAMGEESENFGLDDNNDSQGPSGTDVDYEGSGEMFPQSSYSGEGSSSGGQFEVIEIDDEDEDVAAMFNDSQDTRRKKVRRSSSQQVAVTQAINDAGNVELELYPCAYCSDAFYESISLQRHVSQHHGDQMPYRCQQCGKGFMSGGGLRFHQEAHGERKFTCHVCDSRFKHKHHLKGHLKGVHKLRLCVYCEAWLSVYEFESHVALCPMWPRT